MDSFRIWILFIKKLEKLLHLLTHSSVDSSSGWAVEWSTDLTADHCWRDPLGLPAIELQQNCIRDSLISLLAFLHASRYALWTSKSPEAFQCLSSRLRSCLASVAASDSQRLILFPGHFLSCRSGASLSRMPVMTVSIWQAKASTVSSGAVNKDDAARACRKEDRSMDFSFR